MVLRNHWQDDAFVKPVKIRYSLKPQEVKEIEISIYIPKNIKKDKVVLLFYLETEAGELFGDSLIAIIDIGMPLEESLMTSND